MPDQADITEDDVRRRAEANGMRIEERFVPGIVKGIVRARAALARLDPEALRNVEPDLTFRARG